MNLQVQLSVSAIMATPWSTGSSTVECCRGNSGEKACAGVNNSGGTVYNMCQKRGTVARQRKTWYTILNQCLVGNHSRSSAQNKHTNVNLVRTCAMSILARTYARMPKI